MKRLGYDLPSVRLVILFVSVLNEPFASKPYCDNDHNGQSLIMSYCNNDQNAES